jgi:hypothetical protein
VPDAIRRIGSGFLTEFYRYELCEALSMSLALVTIEPPYNLEDTLMQSSTS